MKAPQYRKLHLRLKKQILGGEYVVGNLLPSENALSEKYGLTRNTVRQALVELEKEGYIIKKQGKGSVVNQKRLSLGLLTFKGFSEVINGTSHTGKTIALMSPQKSTWPSGFFYPLEKGEMDAGCIRLSRLRYVDEQPVMYELTYIPDLILPSLAGINLADHSLFQTLAREYGIEITNLMQDLRAEQAGEDIAGHLKISISAPTLHIFRKYVTNKKGLFIYSSLYCNTEKYFISSEFE